MKITRIINNNCVASIRDEKEVIVTGSGIGFQKSVGDDISPEKVEKVFMFEEDVQRLDMLMAKISPQYFQISQDIIEYGEAFLNAEINPLIIIGLTDHIFFSLERSDNEKVLPISFDREMQHVYPKEYEVGQWALAHIAEELGVELPQTEVAFITMHILNGLTKYTDENVTQMIYFVHKVIDIIEKNIGIEIPNDIISYSRLSMHLKLLADRIFSEDKEESDAFSIKDGQVYLKMLAPKYRIVNIINQDVETYIAKKFNHELKNEETLYFTVHLMRLVDELKEKKLI